MLAFLVKFILFVSFVGVLFYAWVHRVYTYWKRKNVFSPPANFPLGHLASKPKGDCVGYYLANLYNQTKKHPFVGLYILIKQSLLVNDLDLIKNVLSKDYPYFQGHGFKGNLEVDPLEQHLFNLEGEEWKRMRIKLTPAFTSSKMRMMFETMLICADEMLLYIKEQVKTDRILDFKEIYAKFGTDIIGSCAFGIQTNSFKHPDAEFRKMGKSFMQMSFFTVFHDVMSLLFPKLKEKITIRRIPRNINDFFQKTVRETIEYRETNNIKKHDFLQLLIDMKNIDKETGTSFSMEEITAQVFVFFIAGFETSSTTSTFALMELAKNPRIRDELVAKIDDDLERAEGKITYELLNQMTYLTQIVEETLRMYPPLPFLFRTCSKNYKIPGTNVVIEDGTLILLPVLGIQRDPDIYPNPSQFDPERFSPENIKNRHPYAHLPFGEGPRICIGSRFGMMQVKLGLVTILKNYHVELCSKTPINPKYDDKSVFLQTKNEMCLQITPRKTSSS